jgi:cytoskeletal protein CcmA (bactofilin family)
VLNGTVIGDVHANERIELTASAKVTGNVYYTLIEMTTGAEVNGSLIYQGEKTQGAAEEGTAADKYAVDSSG